MCQCSWFSGCLWLAFAIYCQAQPADQPPAADDKLQWGHFSATLRYDGEPPEPRMQKVDKDQAAFKLPLFEESLVIDEDTKGIANVAVWLYLPKGAPQPRVHPNYDESKRLAVELTLRNAQYVPHVSLVRVDQQFKIRNADAVGHNTKGDFFANNFLCDLIPASGDVQMVFQKTESRPMPIADTIHPWMSGWVLVRDNPYMAVSDFQGKLQIKNLPAGEHTFVLWHEVPGFVKELNRDGKVVKLEKGRLTIKIKPGENDLGTILCKPERAP